MSKFLILLISFTFLTSSYSPFSEAKRAQVKSKSSRILNKKKRVKRKRKKRSPKYRGHRFKDGPLTLKFEIKKFEKLTRSEKMEYLGILERLAIQVDIYKGKWASNQQNQSYDRFAHLIFDKAHAVTGADGKDYYFNMGMVAVGDEAGNQRHNFNTNNQTFFPGYRNPAANCRIGEKPCAIYFGLSNGSPLCASGNSTPNCAAVATSESKEALIKRLKSCQEARGRANGLCRELDTLEKQSKNIAYYCRELEPGSPHCINAIKHINAINQEVSQKDVIKISTPSDKATKGSASSSASQRTPREPRSCTASVYEAMSRERNRSGVQDALNTLIRSVQNLTNSGAISKLKDEKTPKNREQGILYAKLFLEKEGTGIPPKFNSDTCGNSLNNSDLDSKVESNSINISQNPGRRESNRELNFLEKTMCRRYILSQKVKAALKVLEKGEVRNLSPRWKTVIETAELACPKINPLMVAYQHFGTCSYSYLDLDERRSKFEKNANSKVKGIVEEAAKQRANYEATGGIDPAEAAVLRSFQDAPGTLVNNSQDSQNAKLFAAATGLSPKKFADLFCQGPSVGTDEIWDEQQMEAFKKRRKNIFNSTNPPLNELQTVKQSLSLSYLRLCLFESTNYPELNTIKNCNVSNIDAIDKIGDFAGSSNGKPIIFYNKNLKECFSLEGEFYSNTDSFILSKEPNRSDPSAVAEGVKKLQTKISHQERRNIEAELGLKSATFRHSESQKFFQQWDIKEWSCKDPPYNPDLKIEREKTPIKVDF